MYYLLLRFSGTMGGRSIVAPGKREYQIFFLHKNICFGYSLEVNWVWYLLMNFFFKTGSCTCTMVVEVS